MTTVTPPPPSPPAPQAAVPQTAPVATVTASAEVLQKLEALKVLEAHVAAMTARNQALLETPAGPVAVRLPPALQVAEGARLTLQLTALLDDTAQARVTAVDGRPTAGPQTAPGTQTAPTTLPPTPGAPQAPAQVAQPVQWAVSTRPTGLPALLVQGPLPNASTAGQPGWPVGTQLTVRLAAVQVPPQGAPAGPTTPGALPGPLAGVTLAGGQAQPPGPGPLPGQIATPGQPAPSGLAPPPAAGPLGGPLQGTPGLPGAATPQAGSPTAPATASGSAAAAPAAPTSATAAPTAPAAGVAPPGTPTAPSPGAPPVLATLTGTVAPQAGTTPLIVTPAGTLSLQTAVPLPPGASVILEVTAAQPPLPPAPGAAAPLPGGPVGAAVAQAMAVLNAEDPEAARRMMAALPGTDARMLTNVVAVSHAATVGGAAGLRAWVGNDTLRALDKAGPRGTEALRGLSEGLREATTVVRDSGGAEWRALNLPFTVGGTIERIQIVTRRHPGDGEDGDEDASGAGSGKGGGGQRFLIHLDLTRLGAMQLDGLYKKRHRRLDLIVRTHETLPRAMQRDLAGIFAVSAQALGLKGGLTFHVSDRFAGPPLEQDGPGTGMMV